MKILIIEDNAIQALTLETIIKRLGFSEVKKVYTPQQAYKILESFQPDLMLVDINLGTEETGIDVVKSVQKNHPARVYYITGNSDLHHKTKADETNFTGYLIKPVDPHKLENMLAEEKAMMS